MGFELFAFAELNHLRMEAMDLFEQSLTNGDEAPFVEFVEEQIAHDPPRLQLLRDLSDDLQQRLMSLREYQSDVRERIVHTIRESYQVDISVLAPRASHEQYAGLSTDAVLRYVRAQNPEMVKQDSALLYKMVEASVRMAGQLTSDIEMTTRLQLLVEDWIEGINAIIARDHWYIQSPFAFDQHHH